MKKISLVLTSGLIVSGMLAGCSNDASKGQEVEVVGEQSEASQHVNVTTDPQAEEMNQDDEIIDPAEAPPTDDELAGILGFNDRSKSDKYYVSSTGVTFNSPTNQNLTKNKDSVLLTATVLIEATDDITGPASIDDLHYQLTDEKGKTVYTYLENSSISTPNPYWESVKNTKLTKGNPIKTDVTFEIPKGQQGNYFFSIFQDGEELLKIRINHNAASEGK